MQIRGVATLRCCHYSRQIDEKETNPKNDVIVLSNGFN